MNEQIGTVAGAIWQALASNGELTLTKLKKEVGGSAPVFDWAVGWLAREDKIDLVQDKKTYRVHLKGWQQAHAA
jgi:hypothetical protein